MTTILAIIKKTGRHSSDLKVVQFSGGKHHGPMIQLTQGASTSPRQQIDAPGFIQLTKEDAKNLILILQEWVNK